MLQKRSMFVLGLLVALSMVLTACGGTATPTTAPSTPAPVTTEAAATAAPTAVPPTTRHGGWLDEIDVSTIDSSSAVTQIKAGSVNIYADGLSPADYQSIKDAGLSYGVNTGLYYDIMYNPAVFKDTSVLNPFSDRKIREATNMLFDRNYINQEFYAGGALVKFFPFVTNGPDYTDLADVARGLEAQYAYNLDKAKSAIAAEMTTLGATQDASGLWQYKGKPVTITFIVRNDGDKTRLGIGDYATKQFQAVGFTVNEQYKKGSEASPIWISSDPTEGKWNVYTAGWINTAIERDGKGDFDAMYAPDSAQGINPMLANTNIDPAFLKLADDLNTGNFTSLDQRRTMMADAMKLGLQDSLQVWLVDDQNFTPYSNDVQVTTDLGAGVEASSIWPYTIRFQGKEGGALKWATTDLFTDPWNPVAGDNWVWDQAIIKATSSGAFMPDPFTGLAWPLYAQKMDLTVQTGLPVFKSLDWVNMTTADSIAVPADAWADWDAKAQTFIPAGDGKTAKIKAVVTFRPDLFTTVKWQDGSPLTPADFVMNIIEAFDRGKKDSAIYDDAYASTLQTFQAGFKGIKIDSTDPLVIEFYTDNYVSDAELNFPGGPVAGQQFIWPQYGFGEAPWQMIAIANMADADGKLAYSTDKADAKKVEWMSWVGGPSLDILNTELTTAAGSSLIPYAPTMSKYITADDAKARYAALQAWYTAHGHFVEGTGPYYLDKVFVTEKTLTLKNYSAYTDLADKWSQFSVPMIATAKLDGPAQVKIGDSVTFDVTVTFQGNPYPQKDVKGVKYLLYDATGAVVATGQATAVADGHWQVVLGADVTSKLTAGSDKIEVAVSPIPVSQPTFTSLTFVTTP